MPTETILNKNSSVKEILTALHTESKLKTSDRTRVCTEENFPVGSAGRQGDIYIHRVPENHPHGEQTQNMQLAEGNSQGSRHVAMALVGDESTLSVFNGTTAPEYCERRIFLGPLVKSSKEFKIYHPEHADVILPAGCYQITHQMDAKTLKRVQD